MTIMLVFGKWVRPHFRMQGWSFGICFGFGALMFYSYDFETALDKYVSVIKNRDLKQNQEISDLKLKAGGYKFSKN